MKITYRASLDRVGSYSVVLSKVLFHDAAAVVPSRTPLRRFKAFFSYNLYQFNVLYLRTKGSERARARKNDDILCNFLI